ncbi:MAG: hypothetical protein M1820_008528 [Bogoriella megaspora]|nr:MAG: hypothetical protein M1820_008528 [Bogoriella megaspora]
MSVQLNRTEDAALRHVHEASDTIPKDCDRDDHAYYQNPKPRDSFSGNDEAAASDIEGLIDETRPLSAITSGNRGTPPGDPALVNFLINCTTAKDDSRSVGIVHRLYQPSCALLRCLLQSQFPKRGVPERKDTRSYKTALRRIYHSYVLWGDGLNVSHGTLDDQLETSVSLRMEVVRLLRSVAKTLTRNPDVRKAKDASGTFQKAQGGREISHLILQLENVLEETIFVVGANEEDSSDSEDDISFRNNENSQHRLDNLKGTVEDLDADVQCLLDFVPALETLQQDNDFEGNLANIDLKLEFVQHHPFTGLIHESYPNAESTLAEQLGRLNWERWLRLQEQRRYNEDTEQNVLQLDTRTVATSSKFQDSGFEGSLPAMTVYAPSLSPSSVSSIVAGSKPSLPPLPSSAESGEPFPCLACGRVISVSTKQTWKNHLISDLKPYVCVFPGCRLSYSPSEVLGGSFWTDHLESKHAPEDPSLGWKCPLCSKQLGNNSRRFCAHLSRHLEDIAMASLPRDCDSEHNSAIGNSSRPVNVVQDQDVEQTENLPLPSSVRPTKHLLFSNLDPEAADEDLNRLFEGIENHVDVRIMLDHQGKSKGFGYADFADEASAEAALGKLTTRSIYARKLKVEFTTSSVVCGKDRANQKTQDAIQEAGMRAAETYSCTDTDYVCRFTNTPVTGVSRPMVSSEAWAMYNFEVHAQRCSSCCRPCKVHENGGSLCEVGQALAKEVAAQLYMDKRGVVFSSTKEDDHEVCPEVNEGFMHTLELLKAIQDGLGSFKTIERSNKSQSEATQDL